MISFFRYKVTLVELQQGVNPINAIKCVREVTGLGLREGKVLVDSARDGFEPTLQDVTPENKDILASVFVIRASIQKLKLGS